MRVDSSQPPKIEIRSEHKISPREVWRLLMTVRGKDGLGSGVDAIPVLLIGVCWGADMYKLPPKGIEPPNVT